jgi:hypothetical protein
VLHSLLEKHKLHGGDFFIVLVEFLLQGFLKFFIVIDSSVSRIVTIDLVNERSENQRLSEDLSFLEIREILFHGRDKSLRVLFVIFRHDESIFPDTVGLMSPESSDF